MHKHWVEFLLCIVLSASIWLIHVLGQPYSGIVNVPLNVRSNIEGRAEHSTGGVLVSARVNMTGFKLIHKSLSHKTVNVFIDASDFEHTGGDNFNISASSLYKYTPELFGDNVTVESFITNALTLKFAGEDNVKVPVIPVYSVTYEDQYMAEGEMAVYPDSVIVYGDHVKLEMINGIYTRPINLKDLDNDVHGEVRLEVPSGMRLSSSGVTYSMSVGRYVEVVSRVAIVARNVPSGVDFTILPSTALATFRCRFPLGSEPDAVTEFYVDYREFASSISGKCLVHSDGAPDEVISIALEPEVCECVEKSVSAR